MIYELHAVGSMGFDGVVVKDGALVATVATEFPLDNVMSALRMQKLTVTKTDLPKHVPGIAAQVFGTQAGKPPPEPPANETTTKGQAPFGGKTKKTK